MSDQTARTSAEPAASKQRATRQLMIKRIDGVGSRPDLRSALRDLLAEASASVEPTLPSQALPHD